MLAFSAKARVLRDCEETRDINGYMFNVFKIQVTGDLEIYALFDSRDNIKVGDCIQSKAVYLTNYDLGRNPKELALRFGRVEILEEEGFTLPECLEVIVNGKLVKSEKAEVKYVNVTRYPFIAVTLSIKNEVGKNFDVLLTAAHKKAEAIAKTDAASYISCKAKLLRRNDDDVFKLVLQSFEVVSPK